MTINTSSSSVYELDRMLIDLLVAARRRRRPGDVDRYIDERRAVHDAAFPPHHAGEAALRRFFAAVSPVRERARPGVGPAWARLRSLARRRCAAPRRRRRARVVRGRASLDAVGFDWYDPVASHAMRCRVAAPARRGARLVLRARPVGCGVAPGRAARPGAPPRRRCAPGSRCGSSRTAWRRGSHDGRPVPRERRHGPAALRARAPRGGGRRRGGRRAGAGLPALVARGQLRVGHLRAALRPLRPGPQRPRGGALARHRRAGRRRGGEFARVLAGLRARGPLGARPPA